MRKVKNLENKKDKNVMEGKKKSEEMEEN